ncbi:sigma-70 family RNA polymerase sigma factor [Rhodohalobacter sp. 614A]|uniref:sigma-70 family RNA polymerase sigma factor n=1 Tax=Rhodohalobacter sp. 614A TaxID=2908649 RepID=UPI001F21480A|nr:sigma-70 family RNA polymerase sigma factor [Rhodohalobacter sp. 614A]
MENRNKITRLLIDVRTGDKEAYDSLFSIVYEKLKEIAGFHLREKGRNKNLTLSNTALVHEAYMKLMDYTDGEWENRSHFYAIASRCMRHILIDYCRKKTAEKRGGEQQEITLLEEHINLEKHAEKLIDLNRLIDEMAEFDERKSKIVEMRFFGGMTIQEISEVLNVSSRTVDRDWLKARMWLLKEMTP